MSEPAVSPGARLKAEREHRGLSAQKAADELHLDRWVIDALEADDYKRIGPTVYAKGHLKKYAALLGLPAAEILAGYESRTQTPDAPVAAGPSMILKQRADASDPSRLKSMQIAVGVAAGLLLLGVLWWRPWHPRGPARHAPAATAPITASPDKVAGAGDGGVSSAVTSPPMARDVSPMPAAPQSAPVSAAAAPAAAVTAAPRDSAAVAGAGRARLRLSFSADSWVDVHDASGRRTYAGTGLANSVKTITGTAPMRVYLRSGSGVQLEINDRAVAIAPQFFAGDVARFEAGADGVLRRDSRSESSRGELSRSDPLRGAQAPSARPSD
jgi:cytoskeleton protein RodZ